MLKSSSFIAFMGLFSVCKISLFIFLVLESALDSIKVLESNADSTFLCGCEELPLKSLFVARLLSLSLSWRGRLRCRF